MHTKNEFMNEIIFRAQFVLAQALLKEKFVMFYYGYKVLKCSVEHSRQCAICLELGQPEHFISLKTSI